MKFNVQNTKILIRKKMTDYTELAKKMDTSYAYLCNVINKGSTSPKFLERLAKLLDIDITELTKTEGVSNHAESIEAHYINVIKEKDDLLKEKDERLKDKATIIKMLEQRIIELQK